MDEKAFKNLIKKYNQQRLTDLEEKQLDTFENELLKRNAAHAFKSSLHQEQVKQAMLDTITKDQAKPNWKKFAAIAASFAILIGLGSGYFSNQSTSTPTSGNPSITISNPADTPKTIHLEDGSTVVLNKQSQITYSKGFKEDSRKVEMQGEAYFQVTKDKEKPFIVVVDGIDVQVLGTEFNVHQADTSIAVTVSTGEVAVYSDDEVINLISDEQVHFDRETKTMHKREINHQLSSLWKQQKLSLRDISMAEFSTALTHTHGIPLYFENEKLENLKLAISYHRQESIEEIIEKVNYINDVKLIRTKASSIMVTKSK